MSKRRGEPAARARTAGRGLRRLIPPDAPRRAAAQVHGWSMFAAFGVLLPAGVLAAHSFRDWPPHWWRAHAAFMTAGYAAALLGFGAGMAMTVDSPALSIHRWIGVAVLSALTLQARARPAPRSAPAGDCRAQPRAVCARFGGRSWPLCRGGSCTRLCCMPLAFAVKTSRLRTTKV